MASDTSFHCHSPRLSRFPSLLSNPHWPPELMTPPVSPDERDKSGKDIAEMKSVSEN
jgi:hypothetical protein